MGRLAARLAPPTASDGSSRSSRLGKTGRTRQQLRRLWPAAYSTPPAAAPPTVSDGLPRGHAVIRCRLRCDRPLGYTLVNVDYYNVMFVQTKCGPCPALGTQTRHNQPAADRLHQAVCPLYCRPLRVMHRYIHLFGDIPTDDVAAWRAGCGTAPTSKRPRARAV